MKHKAQTTLRRQPIDVAEQWPAVSNLHISKELRQEFPTTDHWMREKLEDTIEGENPLVTPEAAEKYTLAEGRGKSSQQGKKIESNFIDQIDLVDLVEAKKAFDPAVSSSKDGQLNMTEFVIAFTQLCNVRSHQLGYLFMKIDCNSDGRVSWDEFLSFVVLQDKSRQMNIDTEAQNKFMPQDFQEHQGILSNLHRDTINHLMYLRKDNQYLSTSHDGTVRVWNASNLEHVLTLHNSAAWVNDIVQLHHITTNKLAVASADRIVTFYEMSTAASAVKWSLHGRMQVADMPICLGYWTQHDRHFLGVGDDRGVVHVYDAKKLLGLVHRPTDSKPISPAFLQPVKCFTLQLHDDWVSKMLFIPQLHALMTCSLDATLKLTDLMRQVDVDGNNKFDKDEVTHLNTFIGHTKGVYSFVHITMSGRQLGASCGLERDVYLWNMETGDLIATLEGHKAYVHRLAYTEDDEQLISLSADGEIRLWDLQSLQCVQAVPPQEPFKDISTIMFNPVHHCLVTTPIVRGDTQQRHLSLWQPVKCFAPTEVLMASAAAPAGHKHPLVGVLYSSQFYLVVSGDEGSVICVWDIKNGQQLFRFEHADPHLIKLTAMRFDASGRRLITGGADGVIRLWNFSSGELLRQLNWEMPGLESMEVTDVLHIQEGGFQYFCAVGWSRIVSLWPDPDKGKVNKQDARLLSGHTEDILCVGFCPPNILATGAYDGVIAIWNLQSGALKYRMQPPQVAEALMLHARAVETLAFLDHYNRQHKAFALVSGGADGKLRLWNVRTAALVHVVDEACAEGETILSMTTEESNVFLLTGDSNGYVKVWDISAFDINLGTDTCPDSGVSLLFHWRAHSRGVVRVEYLMAIEGFLTASTDCTVRLWTLAGEQVGTFGQTQPWSLDNRSMWLDPSRCRVRELHKGKASLISDDQLHALLPSAVQKSQQMNIPSTAPTNKQAIKEKEAGRLSRKELKEVLLQLRAQRPGSAVDDTLRGRQAHQSKAPSSAQALAKSSSDLSGQSWRTAGLSSQGDHPHITGIKQRQQQVFRKSLPPLHGGQVHGNNRKVFSTNQWLPERTWAGLQNL